MKDRKETKVAFSEVGKKKMTYAFWGFAMFPFVIVSFLFLFQSEDDPLQLKCLIIRLNY